MLTYFCKIVKKNCKNMSLHNFPLQTADMVTGIVLAIYGREPSDQRGKFHVDDYCCKEFASQVERPLLPEDRYVLLVSGLQLHSLTEDSLATQLLTDLITGQCGASELQKQMAKITRVIIAGMLHL